MLYGITNCLMYLIDRVSSCILVPTSRQETIKKVLCIIFLDALLTFWIPRRAKLPKHSMSID